MTRLIVNLVRKYNIDKMAVVLSVDEELWDKIEIEQQPLKTQDNEVTSIQIIEGN